VRIESDETVRIRVPRRGARPSRLWYWAGGATIAVVLAAGGVWWSLRPAPPPVQARSFPQQVAFAPPRPAVEPPSPAPHPAPAPQIDPQPPHLAPQPSAPVSAPPPAQPRVPFEPPLATEAAILADYSDHLAIYRFASVPAVIVLQFPSLAEQALMLNRVAALVEKAGYPRGQVMNRDELNARIVAGGDTPDDFYYGHDYRAADLVRFFKLATNLDPQEQRLKALVQKLGWDQKGAVGALVTLVRQTGVPSLDAHARAAILQHELSHGVYFTNPAYAAYCAHFWYDNLTLGERAKFTAFLGREGYDTAVTDLMINETQAYLMHTPDGRFFNAAAVGLSQQRVAELRQIFLLGMPPGWLRDHTVVDKLP
jgi:hypothetical protein